MAESSDPAGLGNLEIQGLSDHQGPECGTQEEESRSSCSIRKSKSLLV